MDFGTKYILKLKGYHSIALNRFLSTTLQTNPLPYVGPSNLYSFFQALTIETECNRLLYPIDKHATISSNYMCHYCKHDFLRVDGNAGTSATCVLNRHKHTFEVKSPNSERKCAHLQYFQIHLVVNIRQLTRVRAYAYAYTCANRCGIIVSMRKHTNT